MRTPVSSTPRKVDPSSRPRTAASPLRLMAFLTMSLLIATGAGAAIAPLPEAPLGLTLVGGHPGGTVQADSILVPVGETLRIDDDLLLQASVIEILGDVTATQGASIALEATTRITVAGALVAGDGAHGRDATDEERATSGLPGGAIALHAPHITFTPTASLRSGAGGDGGSAAVTDRDADELLFEARAADGGKGGDVTIHGVGSLLALPAIHVGNGGSGGDAEATSTGAPRPSEARLFKAVGGAGGQSGALTIDGEPVLGEAVAVLAASGLTGGRGGDGGDAIADAQPPAAHSQATAGRLGLPLLEPQPVGGPTSLYCTVPGACGDHGYDDTINQGGTDPACNGSPGSSHGDFGGNAKCSGDGAYAEAGWGDDGLIEGGDGGRAWASAETGGRGGNGYRGWHINTITGNDYLLPDDKVCYLDNAKDPYCGPFGGGWGGNGARGGKAWAYGGHGGDGELYGGHGGDSTAYGGGGGDGGKGAAGGANIVWDRVFSDPPEWAKTLLGCLIPLPIPGWANAVLCYFSVATLMGSKITKVCGFGGRGGDGAAAGATEGSSGGGGSGLLEVGSQGALSHQNGSPGMDGSNGTPATWWVQYDDGGWSNLCSGTTNPW